MLQNLSLAANKLTSNVAKVKVAKFLHNDDDDQVAKQLPGAANAGKRFEVMGFSPRHPVALFNSLSGCVIEVVESDRMPNWAQAPQGGDGKAKGGALWVDISKVTGATLGNVTGVSHTKTRKYRDKKWKVEMLNMMDLDGNGSIEPHEVVEFISESSFLKSDPYIMQVAAESDGKSSLQLLKELKPAMAKIQAALLHKKEGSHPSQRSINLDLETSTEFAKHMQLMDGWKDPKGIKVRPREGVAAMECLVANDPTGMAAKLGAALMLGVTRALRAVGYEEDKNLRGYGYDWRMPCTKMEERDNYFSRVMDDIEDLVSTNGGEKVVVITHSLGGVTACYFFHWVAHSDYGRSKGAAAWLEHHIHSFVPIGGPLLGTPYGSASYLSGNEGQGLAPTVFSFADRHLLVRSWGMFPMIFPTGRHLMLQPTHSVHWVRREGVLNVHVLQVEMKSREDEEVAKSTDIVEYDMDDEGPSVGQNNYAVRLLFSAPETNEVHDLRTLPHMMKTIGAFDERFQFAWCSTPDEIEDATLTVKVVRDGGAEIAEAEFYLGCHCVMGGRGADEGLLLPGLKKNEWCRYELALFEKSDNGPLVTVTVRMQFLPFSDKELYDDFTRPATEDPGAWRCGGPADDCSSQKKRVHLIRTLGGKEGSEWKPEAKKHLSKHISKHTAKKHYLATYAPMSIDKMMVLDSMKIAYKTWKELYADDKIWRDYSTEAPLGVRRMRPIYGINVPTLIGNVYRRQTKRFNRDEPTTSLKLDKHCEVNHPSYEAKDGIVQEMPNLTPQADDPTVPLEKMTFNTRASGDGTVAYWSLRWPITWRKKGIDVELVEVEGANHRDILDTNECAEAVISECCSYPCRYLEVWLDGLDLAGKFVPKSWTITAATKNLATLGMANDHVFIKIKWRNASFSTEPAMMHLCKDKEKKFWNQRRFVFGVTREDFDKDRTFGISVKKAHSAMVSSGKLVEDTEEVTVPVGKLINDSDFKRIVKFDKEGDCALRWRWRWYAVDKFGMPIFDEPLSTTEKGHIKGVVSGAGGGASEGKTSNVGRRHLTKPDGGGRQSPKKDRGNRKLAPQDSSHDATQKAASFGYAANVY